MKTTAWVLIFLGAVVGAVGIYLGASGVTRDSTDCGTGFGGVSDSALSTDLQSAMLADAAGVTLDSSSRVQDACASAVSDRKTLAWVVVVPGAALLLVGVGLAVAARKDAPTPAAA